MDGEYPFSIPHHPTLPVSPPSFENFEFSNLFSFDSTDPLAYDSKLDPLLTPTALEMNYNQFNLESLYSTAEMNLTEQSRAGSGALLDSNESAMFSSFLSGIQVDEDFLFNPILPPGLPSPPQPFQSERSRNSVGTLLGEKVEGIQLNSADNRSRRKGKEVRRYVEEEEEVSVKQEDSDEYEDVDEIMKPAGRGSTRKSPITNRNSSRSKKLKLAEDEDFSIPLEEEEDLDEEDVEMISSTTTKPRTAQRSLSPNISRSNSTDSVSENKKSNLSDTQKRSNHILSEQKRRNAIRSGFKDLVDLLMAGEVASGISIVAPIEPQITEVGPNGKKKKGKGNGRGRGRKGEIGAGAAKSVILEKASYYMKWLQTGNEALEEEVRRVEALIAVR